MMRPDPVAATSESRGDDAAEDPRRAGIELCDQVGSPNPSRRRLIPCRLLDRRIDQKSADVGASSADVEGVLPDDGCLATRIDPRVHQSEAKCGESMPHLSERLLHLARCDALFRRARLGHGLRRSGLRSASAAEQANEDDCRQSGKRNTVAHRARVLQARRASCRLTASGSATPRPRRSSRGSSRASAGSGGRRASARSRPVARSATASARRRSGAGGSSAPAHPTP